MQCIVSGENSEQHFAFECLNISEYESHAIQWMKSIFLYFPSSMPKPNYMLRLHIQPFNFDAREREREKTECNEQSMVWFCYFYRSATSLVDNGFSSLIRVSLCYMLLHIALLHNGAANLISTLQLTSIKYISVRERATKKRDFALHHILTRTRDIQRIQYAYNGCANERRRVWCFTP